MAANAPVMYNTAREYMADGTIDLDDDTFITLLTDENYTPDAENHTVLTDITNELSGNGYARHSHTATWTRSTTTVTFDLDDATFTASGGSIAARYAVLFDDTPTSPADPLMFYVLLDNTPANVSVTDGNTLTIEWNASGAFDLTGAS